MANDLTLTLEGDPTLASEIPFLVDTGDERYYRVKGMTLHLSDPETGQVSRSIKLVHSLTTPKAGGPAGTPAELPVSLKGDYALSLSLHVEQGPCNPQNPTCPPMGTTVDSLALPFAVHFVVENKP